ncbi:2-hydroxy-6-oxo-6-phenylhexa-2,4-dienoate hydrolase [Anaerolineales bacterium]|nr:2-hydroxy-6-oxo-6-phenylhexa-2,4-dienoate hydrolase [Anaerolineales bacterium]
MTFPYLDETNELNDTTRKEADGSFIALTDGVTHYELGGPENGSPVVLVHGFSGPYFIFDTSFDFLSKSGFRVLRYDLFGRGYSDRPRTVYDIHLFVRQLKDLIDAFELKPVNLVGLSMGGAISATFIDQYPDYVTRHILIDPTGGKRVAVPTFIKALKIPVFGELAFGLFGTAGMLKGIATDMFDQRIVEHFQQQYKIQMKFKGFKRSILSTIRNGMLESFYETYVRVGKLKKPTLLFWGQQDKTVPFDHSEAIMQAIPHAEFHVIENCNHIPHYEKPESVNPILLEFLTR